MKPLESVLVSANSLWESTKTHGWGWLLQTAGTNNCSIVKDDWQSSPAFLYNISGISTLQWLNLIGTIALKWTDCVSKAALLMLLFKSFCDRFWLLEMFSSIPFLFFLFRVPRWELQIGCEQQAKEGADGVHQRADSRTGGRIRPSQLFDQTEAVRNRSEPGSHGKAGEMTDRDLVPVHQSFCQKLPLVFFNPAVAMDVGLLYSRCFWKISFLAEVK